MEEFDLWGSKPWKKVSSRQKGLGSLPLGQADSPRATEALDIFDAVAEELMLKLGIKATRLHHRLRNITEAASQDLPPVQVLYNSKFGDYEYSHAFYSFIIEERQAVRQAGRQAMPDSLATRCALQSVEVEHSRISDVKLITQFGEHIMQRWPWIGKLAKAYVTNDLGVRMDNIHSVEMDKNRLLQNQKIRDSIAAETGRSDGKTEWCDVDFLYNKDVDFSMYAPSALEAMCTELDAQQSKLTLAIQEERDALLEHVTEAMYEEMLQSLDTQLPEEVEAAKALAVEETRPFYMRATYYDEEYLSFTDAIEKYGERHYDVWGCAQLFGGDAIRFLILHPEHTEVLASERDNVKCALRLGLCAASTKICRLRIAEVPSLAEWKVSEYDGLETIKLA